MSDPSILSGKLDEFVAKFHQNDLEKHISLTYSTEKKNDFTYMTDRWK